MKKLYKVLISTLFIATFGFRHLMVTQIHNIIPSKLNYVKQGVRYVNK